MNLLVIADDESILSKMPECSASVLISCGDLNEDTIVTIAQRCRCSEVFAVKGNHDSSASFAFPVKDLHMQVKEVGGVKFGGFCGAWRYKPRGNYLFEEAEVESLLRNFPAVDIFITHNSPRHIHDKDDDVHLGFAAFHQYLQRAKPKFMLHGHQHVNCETVAGNTRIIGTYGFRFLVLPQ